MCRRCHGFVFEETCGEGQGGTGPDLLSQFCVTPGSKRTVGRGRPSRSSGGQKAKGRSLSGSALQSELLRFRPHLSGACPGTTHGRSLSSSEGRVDLVRYVDLVRSRLTPLTMCCLVRHRFPATRTQRLLEEDV